MQTLDLSTCFSNDAMLRRVFSWLTRIGAAPKFGSRPIGWYQIHQCHCIDILKEMGIVHPVCRNGLIRGDKPTPHWVGPSISPQELYRQADNRSRQ